MPINSPVAFPPGPTWVLINADRPSSAIDTVIGQFDPEIQEQNGRPIWQTKPGIAGSQPWLKHVGVNPSFITFQFEAMGNTILDPYPEWAWAKLQEMARADETLGRPPRVYFWYGTRFVEGFITDLPEAKLEYWGDTPIIRHIGPVTVTVTKIPRTKAQLPAGTNFVTITEDSKYEELSLKQYGDARYCQALALHNQGVVSGQTAELPRKTDLPRRIPIAPYLD